jgi:hypothetical protein
MQGGFWHWLKQQISRLPFSLTGIYVIINCIEIENFSVFIYKLFTMYSKEREKSE